MTGLELGFTIGLTIFTLLLFAGKVRVLWVVDHRVQAGANPCADCPLLKHADRTALPTLHSLGIVLGASEDR